MLAGYSGLTESLVWDNKRRGEEHEEEAYTLVNTHTHTQTHEHKHTLLLTTILRDCVKEDNEGGFKKRCVRVA